MFVPSTQKPSYSPVDLNTTHTGKNTCSGTPPLPMLQGNMYPGTPPLPMLQGNMYPGAPPLPMLQGNMYPGTPHELISHIINIDYNRK